MTPGCHAAGRALLCILLTTLLSCTSEDSLQPFASDGCSLFPDSSLISETDWCSCCFEHDTIYWRGGTRAEREAADTALRKCVLEKTDSVALSDAMYRGVRAGGSPYFYNWYRWGYGWSFDRKYQALTPEEVRVADSLFAEYLAREHGQVCPAN